MNKAHWLDGSVEEKIQLVVSSQSIQEVLPVCPNPCYTIDSMTKRKG